MADVHDKQTRSLNMSRIRGKNTKPELLVRKYLSANGFRFKLHDKKLPGKPDIVFPKSKTVIFVNGCYWHGHKRCKAFVKPKTNTRFWLNKINGTIIRDKRNILSLKRSGWKVLQVWECDLKPSKQYRGLNKLLSQLHNGN
jgi:DNA mismatch endonuclease (patch repair protein)